MPYTSEWVAPEKLLKHKGVTVYHTYKDDEIDQSQRWYHFVTDESDGEDGDSAFDVRDLSTWTELPPLPTIDVGMTVKQVRQIEKQLLKLGDYWRRHFNHCQAVIKAAIEKGEIKA